MSNVKIYDAGELFQLTDVVLLSEHNKALLEREKNNADLRHNLEDWKAENEALKQRIKELEETKAKMYDANQLMNASIKELEEENKHLEDYIDAYQKSEALNIEKLDKKDEQIKELEATISILETTAPKWISVGDRLPNEKEQYELLWVGYVRTDNTIKYVYEVSFDYETKQFYTENDWGDKTFIEPDIWMVVPPPPTTEESSPIEKEDK